MKKLACTIAHYLVLNALIAGALIFGLYAYSHMYVDTPAADHKHAPSSTITFETVQEN